MWDLLLVFIGPRSGDDRTHERGLRSLSPCPVNTTAIMRPRCRPHRTVAAGAGPGTASRFKEETYTYLAKLRSIREDLLALEKKRPANNGPLKRWGVGVEHHP